MPKYHVTLDRVYAVGKRLELDVTALNEDVAWQTAIDSDEWAKTPYEAEAFDVISDNSTTVKLDNEPERCSECECELDQGGVCPNCSDVDDLIGDQALDSDPFDVEPQRY